MFSALCVAVVVLAIGGIYLAVAHLICSHGLR